MNTPEVLSIEDSAKILGVSDATVRNWIKTGYLTAVSKSKVSKYSVENFKKKISGIEKLNQRANKSRKDIHDHQSVSAEFLKRTESEHEDIELIGEFYESSLSDSYRNKEGIYYTPKDIVEDLLSLKSSLKGNETFCDPCCGSGNFLIRAIEIGFKPENVYGFDIDPVAVEVSKRRIMEKTGHQNGNIRCCDFLQLALTQNTGSYDYIVTNPPWGKKIDKSEKEAISRTMKAGSSHDTCSLFYFSCLNALNAGGTLGLLLPESFCNVATYQDARLSALSFQIKRIAHYGKPFKGLMTGAVGVILSKMKCNPWSEVECAFKKTFFKRTINSFCKNPKSIVNISCTAEDAEVIKHVYSIPHITLGGRAEWGLGIVTGNNRKYVANSMREGFIPVYRGSDITKTGLKPASCFIPEDFSLYQQVAPVNLYEAKEKLIYKFITSDLCFFHDTKSRYLINSANMLITRDGFPVSMKILCSLFNSDFMNWVFKKVFNTHKVLRGDLELLPIHNQFISGNSFAEKEYLHSINIEKDSCGDFRIKR